MKDKPLVNRVAKSSIMTVNLEQYFPQGDIIEFDIKDYLFKELLLREKDFRAAIAEHDWKQYQGKNLAVFCSTDAIVPVWAFQLVAIQATSFANEVFFGNTETFIQSHYTKALNQLDLTPYVDQRVVIKGCSNKPVPVSAYTELAKLLTPVAKKIMYGEPCSMVPLFKK